MIAGRQYFLQTVSNLIFIIDMAYCDRCKSYDRIHRRPDIMGHIGKECRFCRIGMLRLHQRVLQRLSLLPLFPDLFRDLLCHDHDHNIPGIIIRRHNEGLPYTHLASCRCGAPIINIYFRFPLFKTFLQIFYIYYSGIFFNRLFQNKFFPFFKTLRSPAGDFQSDLFQYGYCLSVQFPHNIILYDILCQIKFKRTDGI